MEKRKTFSGRHRVEILESRTLLAGNVLVSVVDGNLLVRGDHAGNAFEIVGSDTAGAYTIRGLVDAGGEATTVNGETEIAVSEVAGGVRIATGPGDDVVVLRGDAGPTQIAGNLSVDSGVGDDSIRLENVTVQGHTDINSGLASRRDRHRPREAPTDPPSDNDTVEIVDAILSAKVGVRTGAGDDVLRTTGSMFEDGVMIDTGQGDDSVLLGEADAGVAGSHFAGRLAVLLGAGDDHLESNASQFDGPAQFVGMEGDDVFEVRDSTFAGRVMFVGGLADDSLDAGTDSGVNGNSFATPPRVISVETILS